MTDDPGAHSPLTVGTAGHIDHGKTALVEALTGVDTDRLPEEKERGITIALGFAPLILPSGRVLSLVDVPGHERLLRVMVSGASGIDLFLLVVAADDGVMPQTIEHLRVLEALDVRRGVVAVTKSDLADPELAMAEVAELLPDTTIIACSARTGAGLPELAAALERTAAHTPSRAADTRPAVLHVDRVFTIRGAGTVVTGTLWSGVIRRGERLTLFPGERAARVRGVQVHDRAVEAAAAGQRVAVNLAGLERRAVSRGDVLADPGAPVTLTHRLEVRLTLDEALRDRERVQLHHGTRATPARAIRLDEDLWQLRTERPLIAADGDRVVVRRIAPPDTLGGGVIVRAAAGGRQASAPEPPPAAPARTPAPVPPALDAAALALEQRLRAAGHEPPTEAELGEDVASLRALQAAGRAVRIGRSMHAHPEAIAGVREVVERIAQAEGQVTLGRLRDELGTSRKYAQALLEHLDAARVTRRRPDDSRVLRGS
ncbi:MAG TPA: selenocysteine-specific translation elongation factor [Solirubrobacteraceae bacterium]|jgi:selenocysteine-specific elongation factor|nr:selenocysteine-specific translation elongation factor [Solirubrobacteraceae bacterium]